MRGTYWLGGLNFSAFFEYVIGFWLYYFTSIICTIKTRGSAGRQALELDIRAWVRSPGPNRSSRYFVSCDRVRCLSGCPPYAIKIQPSNTSSAKIQCLSIEGPSYTSSQHTHQIWQSQTGLDCLGPKVRSTPPIIASNQAHF